VLIELATLALLLVAALVAIGVTGLRVPYTVALTLVGLFLGFPQTESFVLAALTDATTASAPTPAPPTGTGCCGR
jgi:hypothetical protein